MGKALPKQVQDQIDEADRIAAEIEAEITGENPQLSVVEDEAPAPEEGAPEPVEKGLNFEADPPISDEIDTTNIETPEPEPIAELETDENFEHKYKTLQGMYNSEKRNNAELVGRVQALEGMLANLQNIKGQQVEIVETPAETPDIGEKAASLLTPEEIEAYGPDMIDVVKRAATEAVAGEMATLRKENEQLKSVVGDTAQKQELSARERLYETLTGEVSNWRQVNSHPDFLDWLGQIDVYSGIPRRQMLNRAFEQNDANRVIQFFKGFLKENAALQPAANEEVTLGDSAPAEPVPPKVSLESLASPGLGASGGADNISETGRMWKESEIGKFYEDARKGMYKNRTDDYKATELEIQAALSGGRILVGQ